MIDLPRRVAENVDRFTGRAWLLPKILNWCDKSDDRLFLLTGGPGTGKSMVLAWLANHGPSPEDPTAHAQLTRVRTLVKAAHFCQASSRNLTPQAFAESIANQLTGTGLGNDAGSGRRIGETPAVDLRTYRAGPEDFKGRRALKIADLIGANPIRRF
jgi:hypothetical protein